MGIIRAAVDTARGTLADQWLDVVEAGEMGEQTLFTEGVIVRQGSNRRGNSDVISNGSVIHVYDNQFMILTDGGKIIDYSAEPGYYTVDNGSDKVEIDYVEKKHVKKVAGAKPGFVIYHTNYSMVIGTDISDIQQIS